MLQTSHFPVFIPTINFPSGANANFVTGAVILISAHTFLASKSRNLIVRSSHAAMTLPSHQIAVMALIGKVCPGRFDVML